MQPPSIPGNGFKQRGQERLRRPIIGEYVASVIAPVYHVVKRSGMLDSQLAWHGFGKSFEKHAPSIKK
jgi:hypothetical protein